MLSKAFLRATIRAVAASMKMEDIFKGNKHSNSMLEVAKFLPYSEHKLFEMERQLKAVSLNNNKKQKAEDEEAQLIHPKNFWVPRLDNVMLAEAQERVNLDITTYTYSCDDIKVQKPDSVVSDQMLKEADEEVLLNKKPKAEEEEAQLHRKDLLAREEVARPGEEPRSLDEKVRLAETRESLNLDVTSSNDYQDVKVQQPDPGVINDQR
ncbi:OLC1v1029350C1 [Oldenlandia corymbosa var. corymbosa]|uniref:OLC1v1029350C1 n=1 Tax=Oldenlandia corymbosa var. corymbosa TaxID=529605 RepID=A0AAV1CDW8_OLDCO|nr:OLC1v1029350C1 [Oldenlandia corymbosa var. corymbosa]